MSCQFFKCFSYVSCNIGKNMPQTAFLAFISHVTSFYSSNLGGQQSERALDTADGKTTGAALSTWWLSTRGSLWYTTHFTTMCGNLGETEQLLRASSLIYLRIRTSSHLNLCFPFSEKNNNNHKQLYWCHLYTTNFTQSVQMIFSKFTDMQ